MPRLFVVLFWAAALFAFVLAVLPHPPQVVVAPNDKFQHILAFSVLAGLGSLAYPRTSMVWLLAGLTAFGALIEVVQLIPQLHRDGDWGDLLADFLAATCVLAAVYLWRRSPSTS